MHKIKTTLRVTEVYSFTDAVVHQYQNAASESEALAKDENLAAMIAEMKELAGSLSAAIKRGRTESSLDAADLARDEIIRSFSCLVDGYASYPVPEKKNAAERTLSVFQKYGRGMTKKPYAEESGLIESMIGDFSAESAKADLELLDGVAPLIPALRAAQDKFRIASAAFTDSVAKKGESASEIKKKLLNLINDRLVSYLSALERVPAYAGFVATCAVDVNRANSPSNVRSKAALDGSATPESAENSGNAGTGGSLESGPETAKEESQ